METRTILWNIEAQDTRRLNFGLGMTRGYQPSAWNIPNSQVLPENCSFPSAFLQFIMIEVPVSSSGGNHIANLDFQHVGTAYHHSPYL